MWPGRAVSNSVSGPGTLGNVEGSWEGLGPSLAPPSTHLPTLQTLPCSLQPSPHRGHTEKLRLYAQGSKNATCYGKWD